MIFLVICLVSLLNVNAQQRIVLEDFEKDLYDKNNQNAPSGWSEANKKDGKIDYYVTKEKNNKFLRAEYISGTKGKIIYLDKKYKLDDYPYFSWKWRANKFPEVTKDNLKKQEEPDNVATIYVLFKSGWSNYLLKYTWSQYNCKTIYNEPVFYKSKSSRAFWLIVIRPTRCTNYSTLCCNDPSKVWLTEKVNLKDDFKRLFKKDWLPEYIEGIGILVDGDDTNSAGVSADFDDFVLSKE
jgi:Protein of unknown function (DUF3047)